MLWEYISEGNNAGWWKSSNQGIDSSKCNLVSKEFTVSSDSILKFYWKVSSESYYDKLSYSLSDSSGNIISSNQISGSVASTLVEINLSPGEYNIVFTYSKDGSASRDEDTGYIKDVKLIDNSNFSETGLEFYTDNEV